MTWPLKKMTSALGPEIGDNTVAGVLSGVEGALEADEGVREAGVAVQLPTNRASRVIAIPSDHILFITPSSNKDVDLPLI